MEAIIRRRMGLPTLVAPVEGYGFRWVDAPTDMGAEIRRQLAQAEPPC